MIQLKPLILAAALGCTALGAQAAMPVNAADLPRISNGGTGFIGLTESAGAQRRAYQPMRGATNSIPAQAGEASTMVGGVPNRHQDTSVAGSGMAQGSDRPELRTMGQSGTMATAANPAWGTPK
jgi:hypothetical protein